MIVLVVTVLIIVLVSTAETQKINWSKLLYSGLKIPYGTYAMKQMIPDHFDSVRQSRLSIREVLYEDSTINLFSVSSGFTNSTTELEIDRMIESATSGSHFIICANYFDPYLLDTLKAEVKSFLLGNLDNQSSQSRSFALGDFFTNDTTLLVTTNSTSPQREYVVRKNDLITYFDNIDTTNVSIIAKSRDKVVGLRSEIGEGSIILVTTPYILGNVYMVQGGNHDYLSYLLSFLPKDILQWTEFYEIGGGLAQTPLRYILSQRALKYTLYSTLFILIIFVLFEIKRKQRVIPIVNPPVNDSLQFVTTIGNLYYDRGENHSIAHKRIQYFLEYVRTNMWINTRDLDDLFIEVLSRKSRLPRKTVESLTNKIIYVNMNNSVSDELLKSLSDELDKFYELNPPK